MGKNKILLINAVNPSIEVEIRYPPLGLGYLVSRLRNQFGPDRFHFKICDKDIERELDGFRPDIVGISSVSQNYNIARRHAFAAKSRGIPVIIGGIHISMLPESLTEHMDVGVMGEGEETLAELMEIFMENEGFPEEGLSQTSGIAYRCNGDLRLTPPRPPVAPLDGIPLPARDHLKIESHSYIFSSRGCPYRCTFCASSRYWDKLRFFSPEYVVNEIRELADRHNVRFISFFDDLMMADKKRLARIVELLRQDDILDRVKFAVNARANLLTEDVVKLLSEMRVVSVGMGLESGSERILRYLKGKGASIHENINAVQMLKKYKIAANASFIMGCPDETREEILETLDFIKKSDLDLFDVYLLTPFPGTPTWSHAKERGLVSEDMDWDRLNVTFAANHKKAIILSETLSRAELHRLFKEFRKLQLRLIAKNILTHPFLADVPRMARNKLIEKSGQVMALFRGER